MYTRITDRLMLLALRLTPRATRRAQRRYWNAEPDSTATLLSHRVLTALVGQARAECYLLLRAERRYGRTPNYGNPCHCPVCVCGLGRCRHCGGNSATCDCHCPDCGCGNGTTNPDAVY